MPWSSTTRGEPFLQGVRRHWKHAVVADSGWWVLRGAPHVDRPALNRRDWYRWATYCMLHPSISAPKGYSWLLPSRMVIFHAKTVSHLLHMELHHGKQLPHLHGGHDVECPLIGILQAPALSHVPASSHVCNSHMRIQNRCPGNASPAAGEAWN